MHGALAGRADNQNPCARRCQWPAHYVEADGGPGARWKERRGYAGSDRRGQILLADRAYDSDALRTGLAERGAWANVKPMPRRTNIPSFSAYLYRFRNLVERFFNKLKHFRAIATRFEKHDANYLALVTRLRQNLDAIYESVT